MADLKFVFAGEDAVSAADRVGSALVADSNAVITHLPSSETSEVARRIIDPISLAALVISVPAAVLAVWDLADRIAQKRPKAQAVIDTANQLKAENGLETYVVMLDGTPRAVTALDADQLLDIVAAIEPPPPQTAG